MPEKKNTIGRFEIIEKIGEGPIGAVYKALDPVIRRTVAIKVIKLYALEETTTFAEIFEKIYKVVRTSTSLNHPNICIIYDLSEEKKIPYVTMEYVDGNDLEALLQQKHQFKKQELINVLRQVCDALDFAHRKNVVHQDLKSTNILVTRELQVKITDFGIAGLDEIAAAQTKKLLSIPFYISPEQALGERVTPASDLFSLGVVMYHLLSGQLPFPGSSAANTIMMIARDSATLPLDLHKSGIRRDDWESFFNVALAKSPAQRFRTAREMMDALSNILPANDQAYFPYSFAGQFDDSTGEFEKTFLSDSPPTVLIDSSQIVESSAGPQDHMADAASPTYVPEPEPSQVVEQLAETASNNPDGATIQFTNYGSRAAEQPPVQEAYVSPPTELIQMPNAPGYESHNVAPPTQMMPAPTAMSLADAEFPREAETIPPTHAPATQMMENPMPELESVEDEPPGATLIYNQPYEEAAVPPPVYSAPTQMMAMSPAQPPEGVESHNLSAPTLMSHVDFQSAMPAAAQIDVQPAMVVSAAAAQLAAVPASQPAPAVSQPVRKPAGPPNLRRYYFGAIAVALFVAIAGFIFFSALFKQPQKNVETPKPAPNQAQIQTPVKKAAPVTTPVDAAPTTGRLAITTEPAGATVLLNDVEKGITPVEITDLAFGTYTLKVQLKGYKEMQQEIVVSDANPNAMPLVLEKAAVAAGTLVVESNPAGAFVVIGNRVVGVTPKTLTNTRAGKYNITLKKDGYEDYIGTIRVSAEKTATFTGQLREIPKPVVVVPPPKPKPPEVTRGQLVALGPDVVPPRAIKKPFAKYPEVAKAKRIQGTVTLNILVSETGKVIDYKVVRSANPLLDEAVIKAYQQWEYEPATKKGVPVKVWVTVSMTFQTTSR